MKWYWIWNDKFETGAFRIFSCITSFTRISPTPRTHPPPQRPPPMWTWKWTSLGHHLPAGRSTSRMCLLSVFFLHSKIQVFTEIEANHDLDVPKVQETQTHDIICWGIEDRDSHDWLLHKALYRFANPWQSSRCFELSCFSVDPDDSQDLYASILGWRNNMVGFLSSYVI